MVKWTDIEDSGGGGGVKWSDIEGDGKWITSEILPIAHNPQTGETSAAIPGFVRDLYHLAKAPGEAYAGRLPTQEADPVTGEVHPSPEAIKTGLNIAAIASPAGVEEKIAAGQAATRGLLQRRVDTLPEVPPATIPEAQRTAAIKAKAGARIQEAKDSGVTVPASEARGLLDQIKADTASEYNPETHDAARGFFKKFESYLPKEGETEGDPMAAMTAKMPISGPARASLEKKLAEMGPSEEAPTVTVKNLHNLRQELNDVHKHAQRSGYDQEGMVASKAKSAIDDFIVNKMDQGQWSNDMRNYALSSTAEEIKNLTDRALYRRTNLSAGQKAAALNTELRQWARPTLKGSNSRMKMLRALSPEAADKMEFLAKGGHPLDGILKGLGSASPGSIMSFSLDNIAGHLLHGIIPGGPYTIMGIGAAAKYMGGARVEKGIEGIIKTLNDAADAEPKLSALQKAVDPAKGPSVFQHLMSKPATAQAIRQWANAKGPRKKVATLMLAATMARELNTPHLVPRIQQELENIDPDRTTTVPETMAQQ